MPTLTTLLLTILGSAMPTFDGTAGLNCTGAQGECCKANGTPGCDDLSCCLLVCFFDPFCCEVQWDATCADEAVELCEQCASSPDPCIGAVADCCVAHENPGCDDPDCCNAVCHIDPVCCEITWDALCAAEACEVCAKCGCTFGPDCPGEGSCCVANGTPGCDNAGCCDLVCAAKPFCCTAFWDSDCAKLASTLCGDCADYSYCPGVGGDCSTDNGTPGCGDVQCCEVVCGIDAYCCDVAWDATCVIEGGDLCGSDGCFFNTGQPVSIVSADPPSGTVDARQPHVFNNPLMPLGIGGASEPIVLHFKPTDLYATYCDMVFCETAQNPLLGPNAITSSSSDGEGNTTVILRHPITANAVTTIWYIDGSYVQYISHPGNVDGDSAAGASDVLALVDIINGVLTPEHGVYSSDIDHSGAVGGVDVLRVIDLLNGAGGFEPQFATALPTNENCTPPNCPGEGDCCSPSDGPGCVDPDCCATVCTFKPSCCQGEWDFECAIHANNWCDLCDEP